MAKRKVTAANWPTQHLVLWRTTLDDVPLLLTPDRKIAERYAKTLAVNTESESNDLDNRDALAAHRVMGLDICSPCNISIVSFRNGRPYRLKVIRETFGSGAPIPPPSPITDAERAKRAKAIASAYRREKSKAKSVAARAEKKKREGKGK